MGDVLWMQFYIWWTDIFMSCGCQWCPPQDIIFECSTGHTPQDIYFASSTGHTWCLPQDKNCHPQCYNMVLWRIHRICSMSCGCKNISVLGVDYRLILWMSFILWGISCGTHFISCGCYFLSCGQPYLYPVESMYLVYILWRTYPVENVIHRCSPQDMYQI